VARERHGQAVGGPHEAGGGEAVHSGAFGPQAEEVCPIELLYERPGVAHHRKDTETGTGAGQEREQQQRMQTQV